MTPGVLRRNLALSVSWKIGIPLLLGVIAIVVSDIGGLPGRSTLELAALITVGFMLVMFLIDFEIRLAKMDERTATGFEKIGRSAQLLDLMERSALDTALLTGFVETAGAVDKSVNPLLESLARREVERVTRFIRLVPTGSEIAYDGEDREWLLGLTEEAQSSIDAISLSTVDAGLRGFDGGLWTSDLGIRYLELQRQAIDRNVTIRRIFVFEEEDLARDETFMKITEMQRQAGVDIRMLDHQVIPESLQAMIFDFIIFDGAVSYEMTPATAISARGFRPAMVRTLLAPSQRRVSGLEDQFEQMWKAADPERQILQ
jgi:hypothetical protein